MEFSKCKYLSMYKPPEYKTPPPPRKIWRKGPLTKNKPQGLSKFYSMWDLSSFKASTELLSESNSHFDGTQKLNFVNWIKQLIFITTMQVEFQSIRKLQSKTCNRNVCTSLLTKVEKTITEGEALNALLTQRRERLLEESASRVKKGSEEEVDHLNGFKG